MNPGNFSSISFPFLGLEVNPPRTVSLGPLTIHLYGLAIGLGLILAVLYACRRSKEFGLKEDDILDGVLWITPLPLSAPASTTWSSPGRITPTIPCPFSPSGRAALPFTAASLARSSAWQCYVK